MLSFLVSDYRRQFPASPIVADSAMVGDDGVPAVSLPHEKYRVGDATRAALEHQKIPTDEHAERSTITSLTEPMLLVDGVMGLPLRGQAPSDRGTAILSNALAHSRDSRLLTAKKKLLVRQRCRALQRSQSPSIVAVAQILRTILVLLRMSSAPAHAAHPRESVGRQGSPNRWSEYILDYPANSLGSTGAGALTCIFTVDASCNNLEKLLLCCTVSDEGARRWLSELSTRSVAVISICGELQTGKSGLANLLLDE